MTEAQRLHQNTIQQPWRGRPWRPSTGRLTRPKHTAWIYPRKPVQVPPTVSGPYFPRKSSLGRWLARITQIAPALR